MLAAATGATGPAGAGSLASTPWICFKCLRESYGEIEAVRGIDLSVEPGEIFGFLGPNGADKTTTISIL